LRARGPGRWGGEKTCSSLRKKLKRGGFTAGSTKSRRGRHKDVQRREFKQRTTTRRYIIVFGEQKKVFRETVVTQAGMLDKDEGSGIKCAQFITQGREPRSRRERRGMTEYRIKKKAATRRTTHVSMRTDDQTGGGSWGGATEFAEPGETAQNAGQ